MRLAPALMLLPLAILLAAFADDEAVSPDGRAVAFLRAEGGGGPALWIRAGGAERRLVAPVAADSPKRNLTGFHNPVFSPDGRSLYFETEAWVTSSAIHRVDLATGRTRYVVDGWLYGVLRNGPRRGCLVVGQHRYHGAPHYGSWDPVAIVRPDGRAVLRIPGGEDDPLPWLKRKGWRL